MERIKLYSKYDMTSNDSIHKIIEFTNNFSIKTKESDINDILEYFNIIKFSKDNEIREIIANKTNNEFDVLLKLINQHSQVL